MYSRTGGLHFNLQQIQPKYITLRCVLESFKNLTYKPLHLNVFFFVRRRKQVQREKTIIPLFFFTNGLVNFLLCHYSSTGKRERKSSLKNGLPLQSRCLGTQKKLQKYFPDSRYLTRNGEYWSSFFLLKSFALSILNVGQTHNRI